MNSTAVLVDKDLRIAVVGLGYIGLPTAAILAAQGVEVVGVDINPDTVAAVNAGEPPFVEPDLATYVSGAVQRGLLSASTEMPHADVYIVAVPTPFLDDHAPDLSYIKAAGEAIAPQLRGGELVILESTSPPGATQKLADWIFAARPDLVGSDAAPEFAHCPERVLPGKVMVELVENDRIVGGLTPRASKRACEVYAIFCNGQLLTTDAMTAEMAKLVENSFRDVNIAFANELSLICDRLGIDVWELIELANHHPRVNILQPGPGVGGHCIAVDPWFIVDAAPDLTKVIRSARDVNDGKPQWVLEKVLRSVDGSETPVVAALGLAFKPDIDDLRESPARRIAGELADQLPGGRILVVEPHIDGLPAELANRRNVELVDIDRALAEADLAVLLVDHTAFKGLRPAIPFVDTRGIWK